MSIANFYGWLSWFQDLASRVGHDTGQRDLTVHRRLRTPAGERSGTVVHTQLLDALRTTGPAPDAPRVLDAGCGLGGTTFFLQSALGGRHCGITLSETQRDRATREARRRGHGDACRFVARSFDDDLSDVLPDGADLIVAIESLAHAADPVRSVARLARCLRPGGRFAIVDDMPLPHLTDGDPDFAAFRRGWLCPAVASATRLRAALGDAGLRVAVDADLTPLVHLRNERSLTLLVWLSAVARVVTRPIPARVLVESLHGGLMLERLYRRGLMEYRLLIATRSDAVDRMPSGLSPRAAEVG